MFAREENFNFNSKRSNRADRLGKGRAETENWLLLDSLFSHMLGSRCCSCKPCYMYRFACRKRNTRSHTQETWVSYNLFNETKIQRCTSTYNLLSHNNILGPFPHQYMGSSHHLMSPSYSIRNAPQCTHLFLHSCTVRWWLTIPQHKQGHAKHCL